MGLVVGLLAPWFAAWGLVRCLDARAERTRATAGMHLVLAAGVGLGLSSCGYFLGLLFCGPPGPLFRILETLGYTGAGVLALWLSGRPAGVNAVPPGPPAGYRRWRLCLAAILGLCLTMCVAGIVARYHTHPHGEWDGFSMWNMRARLLYRLQGQWREAFSPVFVRADYPLLLPAANARLWSYLGRDPIATAQLTAAALSLGAVLLLAAGVGRLRGAHLGLLAGMALAANVGYLKLGTAMLADVPLSFFILATLLLLAVHDTTGRPAPGLLGLAGLTAALAAWTKNEGLIFLLAVLAVRSVVAWRSGRGRGVLRQMGPLLAGAAPVLAVLVLFKVSLYVPNDVAEAQTWAGIVSRLGDASRYRFIAGRLLAVLLGVGKGPLWVLLAAGLLLGGAAQRPRGVVAGIAAVLGLVLAGYFLVYLTTPHDLAWHVNGSAQRLLSHLWPSALLAAMVYLADPLTILAGPGSPPPVE